MILKQFMGIHLPTITNNLETLQKFCLKFSRKLFLIYFHDDRGSFSR